MSKKLTQSEFLIRANNIHNNLYDYSKTLYVDWNTDIIVTCKIHGDFQQSAGVHIRGFGCQQCTKTKRRNTNIKNHGVDNIFKNKEYIKQQTIKKCGVHNVGLLSEVKEKRKKTNLELRGVEYASQDPNVKLKVQQTNLNHRGVTNPFLCPVAREKARQTSINRIGVDHYWKSPAAQERRKISNMLKYGVEYTAQAHLPFETIQLMNNSEYLMEQHHGNKFTIRKIAEILGVTPSGLQLKFNKLGIPKLNFGQSQGERDIVEFLSTFNISITTNNRQVIPPLELDIFLPDHNIAIEYCGVYWHSELQGKDSRYHLNKTKLCNSKNIRLLQIFESEWQLQPDIVKSRLITMLGLNTIIYARKCKIVNISNIQAREFLNDNHIQGYVTASVNIGLQYNDTIVAVMTFGKSRFNKNIEWELVRFANIKGYTVVGGASKLFKYFTNNYTPQTVISYSDKRWNTGGLYLQLGFQHSHTSSPNFFYFKHGSNKLLSRQQFQKHKLKDKLEFFNTDLSAWQNMVNNGYNRIWDCGNEVFIYHNYH
jgi:hypothetical protein